MSQLLPIELQLLLACARVTIDADQRKHIQRLIAADPDWELLVRTAQRHGLYLLLHRSLCVVDQDCVPSAIIEKLAILSSNYRRRNLVLVAELLRVVTKLQNAEIGVIPYKGPALAQYVYRDFVLREFVDLDILVKPGDAVKARRVLMTAGLPPARSVSRLAEQLLRYFHCEFTFFLLSEVRLEVNWRQAPAYWLLPRIDDKVWERLGSLRLAGADIASLDPVDLLIVLCIHGCKHIWDTLKWLVDVAELVRGHPELDWEALHSRAHELGAEIMLEIGLVLAHDLLQAPVPANVLKIARQRPRTLTLVSEIRERGFAENTAPSRTFQELPFLARAAQKPGAKVMPYFVMLPYLVMHHFVRPAGAQLAKITGGLGQKRIGATKKN